MTNRLPSKLVSLRKYFNYSQAEIAERLNITINEYMSWENGSAICSIYQMKALCEIFHVSIDEMLDNTKTVTVTSEPEHVADISPLDDQDKTVDLSAQIFPVGTNNSQASLYQQEDEIAKTKEITNTAFVPSNTGAAPKVLSTYEYDDASRPRKQAQPQPRQDYVENNDGGTGPSKMGIVAVAVVAITACVVIGLVLMVVFGKKENVKNEVSDVNRLAVGNSYSVYVERGGSLKTNGNVETSGFSSITQVSAFESKLIGLKEDGTVVANDSSAVSDWKGITYIAAGRYHVAGLKSDGTVVCTGSSAACAVDTWTDIKAVYAGDDVTVGLTKDGRIKMSPASTIEDLESGVTSVCVGNDVMILGKTNGSAKAYRLSTVTQFDLTSWNNVKSVAAGDGLLAAILSDNTVVVYGDDEAIKEAVKEWQDIRYIDINGNTLVGVNGSGRTVGVGTNHGQYIEEAPVEPTKEPEEEKKQLEKVSNITFSETTANIVIRWDAVENAEYYELSINTSPETHISNIGSNSTSIPAGNLENNKMYTVTVIAHSIDYDNSDPSSVFYEYKAATVQLASVTSIVAKGEEGTWLIAWSAVDHADYYLVSYDGYEGVRTNTADIKLDLTEYNPPNGSVHNIAITACSDQDRYLDSEPTRETLTYEFEAKKYLVSLSFTATDGSVIDSINTLNMPLEPGTYKLSSYVPEGYVLTDASTDEFTVNSDLTMQVLVSPKKKEQSQPKDGDN